MKRIITTKATKPAIHKSMVIITEASQARKAAANAEVIAAISNILAIIGAAAKASF